MEYVWNILNYVIAGYLLSTLLFLGSAEYIQILRPIRSAYLTAANKIAAATELIKIFVMFLILPQPFDANNLIFSFPPPVLLFLIIFPGVLSLMILFGKRPPESFVWWLLSSLALTKITELLSVDKRVFCVPYIAIIIVTILYFTGCYIYARRKTDGTPSS